MSAAIFKIANTRSHFSFDRRGQCNCRPTGGRQSSPRRTWSPARTRTTTQAARSKALSMSPATVGNTWVHHDLPLAASGNENARAINFFGERERNPERAMITDKCGYNQSIAELQWRSFCRSFTNNRLSPKGEHIHASSGCASRSRGVWPRRR